MVEGKMRKKIEEGMMGDMISLDDRWGVLQENLTRDIKANELKQEKVWVKEGACDECGAFDVLSRVEDKFICPECIKLLKNNNKSKRKNSKRKGK